MDYSFEHEAYLKGYTAVCGIDEAGRGPLAGPVYAAAVWLPDGLVIDGLNDSKKLSEKKREALFDVIKENAVAYGIGFAADRLSQYPPLSPLFLSFISVSSVLIFSRKAVQLPPRRKFRYCEDK